jgi:hypothetical protein
MCVEEQLNKFVVGSLLKRARPGSSAYAYRGTKLNDLVHDINEWFEVPVDDVIMVLNVQKLDTQNPTAATIEVICYGPCASGKGVIIDTLAGYWTQIA